MSDLEFLERLQQELTHGAAWTDIAGVGTQEDEPDLVRNELRVHPVTADPAQRRVNVFRMILEWEVRPRRSF